MKFLFDFQHDQFFETVGDLFSQQGYNMPNKLDQSDVLNYIKELRIELDKSQYRLEEVLHEKVTLILIFSNIICNVRKVSLRSRGRVVKVLGFEHSWI